MSRYSHDRGTRFLSIGAAGNFGQVPKNNGVGATTGAGDEIGVVSTGAMRKLTSDFIWDVVIGGTGSYTSFNINLEGSNNAEKANARWDVLDTSTAVAGESRAVVNKPYKYYRVNVTAAVVASGAPTIEAGITI